LGDMKLENDEGVEKLFFGLPAKAGSVYCANFRKKTSKCRKSPADWT
jgi:hypothetical protein